MNRRLLAAGGLLLAGISTAGVLYVTSSGGEEEIVQQNETATPNATGSASPSVAASPTSTADASPTPTPAWNTFTNTAFGYSFQYPADWLIDPHNVRDEAMSDYVDLYNYQPPETGSGGFLPPDKLKIEVVALDNSERLRLEQWVATFNMNSKNGLAPVTVISSTPIEVNGTPGIREIHAFGPEAQSLAVFFSAGEKVFLVSGPQADSMFLDLYEQLLASFKFNQ